MRRKIQGALAAVVATVVAGCAPPGTAPRIEQVEDQIGFVGEELVILLFASDPDGSSLVYSFSGDVPDIQERARISPIPGGAEFRWTPLASDVGEWFLDFRVSDGSFSDRITVRVEVRPAVGESPIFRQPLGSGTTLDVSETSCLELDVVVDAPSVSQVQLGQEPPIIEGAELEQTSGLAGVWTWCPSSGQIEQSDRYLLTLSADDGENPPATKQYLIILQQSSAANCPGEPPQIEHRVEDEETLASLTITARVRDDSGLKRPPLLFHSHERPADPPDLGRMNPIEMLLTDGDRRDGLWAADVPNPVAGLDAGSRADVYYVITAQSEAEIEQKKCQSSSQVPDGSSYAMSVTNPGGSGGLGLCEPCTADAQCRGADDLCVRVGGVSTGSCLEACTPGSCPSGSTCSAAEISSVDGRSGRQCIPDSGTCTGTTACEDDAFAPNYSPLDAAVLEPGNYELVMCPAPPGDDQNWFLLELEDESRVSLEIEGGDHSDLDLWLFDPFGGVIARSMGFDSQEEIFSCLPPGAYFAVVNEAFIALENPYSLTYERVGASCADFCANDEFEPDDTPEQAREASLSPVHESYGVICPGDSDFFAFDVYAGEVIGVELLFEQRNILEDLDLRLYDQNENLLTPCSEEEPELCRPEHGQSSTSNEFLEYHVEDPSCFPCTYYIEVRGFAGASNFYEIRLGLSGINI